MEMFWLFEYVSALKSEQMANNIWDSPRVKLWEVRGTLQRLVLCICFGALVKVYVTCCNSFSTPHLLNSVSVFRRWWLGPYYDRTPITCVTYGQHWSTIEVFQSESSFTMHRKALQYDATSIPVRNGSPNLWSWDDRYSLCIYIYIFFNVVACKRIALKAIPRSKEILQKWPPEPGQQ